MNDPRMGESGPSRRAILRAAGGVALAGTLVSEPSEAGNAEEPQVKPAGAPAIDIHVHVTPPRLPGLKPLPEDVGRLQAGPVEALATRLRREMEGAAVSVAFGMGALDCPDDDPLGVGETLRLATLVPGLKAIGVADPRHTGRDRLKAIEGGLDRGRGQIVALKAYLGYVHVGPEEPGYLPYYRLAEKYGLPVIFHTGDNWSTTAKLKYAHPLRVDEVAVDHPGVTFVMAHMGNPWLVDAAEVLFKNGNVHADLSGLFVGDAASIDAVLKAEGREDAVPGLEVAALKRALAYAACPDRILYGSDWPLAPLGAYSRLIEAIVPKEHHPAVFRTNAERLFRLKV